MENLKHIDIYINPNLKGFSAASFNEKKMAEMIKLGEEAGEKAMKELEKVKQRITEK